MLERLIRNQDRHARLMGEMMRRFGVLETETLSQNDAMCLGSAARRCMGCRALDRCEAWMAETMGTEGAEAFCPNVRTFVEIASH